MAKAAVFTIKYGLKIKLDLKQFQKNYNENLELKLVSPSPWINSYMACLWLLWFIYHHSWHNGGGGGGIWQKITGTSASSNTAIVYWWWSHDSVDWVITHFNVTGYHPPGPLFFPVKIPASGQLLSAKPRPPGGKNETKIPTPGHNLPCSNAKRSMKKEHNSIKNGFFPNFP